MSFSRWALTASAVVAGSLLTGCKSDSTTAPVPPSPILGLTASAKSSTSVQYGFTTVAGDGSYLIERAEGATGTFAADTTITAPATATPITVTRGGLKFSTTYRFRVTTVKGGLSSVPSSEASVTTLGLGNASADITTDITASRTLFADTVYTLKGFIHVANGATLTIQPGTKIVGDFNTLGSSLWILRGAKLQAVGTADLPIVFTSSRAAGQRQPGDWGGLLFVGNAPDNRSGIVNVEGSGVDGSAVVGGKNYFVQYNGGTVATDNSGTISYVRVEFAGYAPLVDQEFNAFTFAAIGSGTRVSFVEAMAGLDDSFEFFGGGFDFTNAVAFETADDMFDMSEGWSGRMQYLIGYNSVQLTPRTGAGFYSVDIQGIENDGCNGTGCDLGFNSTPYTIPLVSNFTLIGCGSTDCSGTGGGYGMMLRRGTGGYYVNGVLARWARGGVSLRDSLTFDRAGRSATPDVATSDLVVRNVLFAETPTVFQAPGAPTAAQQNAFDLAGNNLTNSTALATALFTAVPATGVAPANLAAFDFTPAAGSAIATGGMATFAGKIAAKAGTVVTATSYLGAVAPAGPKWWQGWTTYARN
ncbi:MAG: fibronectin type III domain-containing protein [Gemmatimonadaceae bacterium]